MRADELGAQVAAVDEILADPAITSVVVCSETRHHLDLVTRAAAAGKHLFVEKPLSANRDEAAQMEKAVRDAGVVFQTGFFMRSAGVNQFLKQEIEAGHLGTVTRMRYTNCHQGHWRVGSIPSGAGSPNKTEAGGGGFADLGAHALDIVLWCLSKTCGPVVKRLRRSATRRGAMAT